MPNSGLPADRENQERFELAAQAQKQCFKSSLEVASCVVDHELRYLEVGERYAKLFGENAAAMIGANMQDFSDGEHIQAARRYFPLFESGWIVPDHQLHFEQRILRVSVSPLKHFATGEVRAIALSMTDVTSSNRFVANLASEPPKAQVANSSLSRRNILRENVEDADVGQKTIRHKFRLAQQKKILAYVDSRLREPISVKELSALVNLSASHFSRKFKLTFGDPPCTWLLSRRLQYARKLIAEDETPLKVIAVEAGFADQSHMTRAFQSFVGLTPGNYRQQLALPSNDRDLAKSGRV